MDPERWSAVRALFDEVVELPPPEARALLAERRATDPELVARVEAMLAQDRRTEGLLDRPASEILADGDAPSSRRVGNYRLLELLGTGGMGAVWRAERADGTYEGEVAVKLVRTGFGGDELRDRFRQERQILANLRHPHIARLLDGGATEDDAPFLVMELVEGRPVDLWCDEQALSVERRLRLFLEICSAVGYAHRRMVVHRDLKPANILVAPDGTPTLLDFGIAKLIETAEDGRGALTRTGTRLLTPRYASPEQIRGEPVTVASDVYSLGVLLHRLLTGALPYAGVDDTAEALERAVLAPTPRRLSASVTEGAAPPGLPTAGRLRRRLRGDLDTIVLTALHSDVDRRYGTVDALARDVERHLDGLPVEARPDRWSYRAGKFVSRNRVGVTVAAGVALLLAGTSVALAVQAERLAQERDVAVAERAKAQRVSDFLVDVFEANDPSEAQGVERTAGEILSRGARQIRSDLTEQPEVRAALMDAIADSYQLLGAYDSARALFSEALELRREALGPDGPDVLRSLTRLGTLARLQGRYDDAVQLHREALEGRRDLLGPEHADVAESLSNLGLAERAMGNAGEAERLLLEALRIRRAVLDPADDDIAVSLDNLAAVYDERGMADSTLALMEASLAIRREALGTDHLDYAISLNNLATAYQNAGRYAEAEEHFLQSLDLRRRLLRAEHPMVLVVENNLAVLLLRAGRLEEAVPYLDAVVEARRAVPEERVALSTVLSNRGVARVRMGRPDAAARDFLEAIALVEAELGPDHPVLAYSLSGLSASHRAAERWDEAEAALRRALRLRESAFDAPHALRANSLDALGSFYLDRGRVSDARGPILEALEMREALLGGEHPDLAESLEGVGRVHLQSGDGPSAVEALERAVAIRQARGSEVPVPLAVARSLLGQAYAAEGDPERGRALLADAHARLLAELEPDDPRIRAAAEALAELDRAAGSAERSASP